jgi:signal transduction histidine kinase
MTVPSTPQHSEPSASGASSQELQHELRVHQIELEMQNEELRRTQLELAAARDRFMDLYDFAPVGYFTLDANGRIVEVNLTGASMLGEMRHALLNTRFARFVKSDQGDDWQQPLAQVLKDGGGGRVDVALQPAGLPLFHGQLDFVRAVLADGTTLLRMAVTDVSTRKLAEMDRRIADKVIQAGEAERRRVARQLHEELGQRLSVLKMGLSALGRDPGATPGGPSPQAMAGMLDEAISSIRSLALELRPLMLDDLGLNEAIDWLARDSAERLGLEVTLALDDQLPPLSERVTIGLYRLIQEILSYLSRPGHAPQVHIEMQHQGDELVLRVHSTGGGWPLPSRRKNDSLGVQALGERAHLLCARLELSGEPGADQDITVRVSLACEANAHHPSTCGVPHDPA